MIKGIGGSLKENLEMSGAVSADAWMTVFLRKSDLQAKCSYAHYWINVDHAKSHSGFVWMNWRPHDKLGAEPGMYCRTLG